MNLRRRPPRHSRPGLDWLETRNLLSGSASSLPDLSGVASPPPSSLPEPADEFDITAVTPALTAAGGVTGAGLAQSPTEISITFSQPINLDLLPTVGSPIALYRVVGGVTTDSIFDATPPVSVSVENGDTRLVITLDPTQPLSPGSYRLVIPAGTPIYSSDFTPLPGSDNDIVLGDFAVAAPEPAVARSQAIDLGTILPNPLLVSGSLDLIARPHDVALFKIQVPNNIEQSAWRLGLEVRAADGSNLRAGLTLFDAQGRPIASSIVGRPTNPGDPYLFTGVEPGGTYYVGVSSPTNMAGQPGGYEIESAAGTLGGNPESQTGGQFVIGLVADPIDAPTKALFFNLDHADPLDATPSGFTIGFNAAVEPGSGIDQGTGELTSSLRVVDSRGQAYNLTLTSFDESNARLSFLFPRKLPAGSYSVVVPGSGGLVDLLGRSPVADGLPGGILARFVVAESPSPGGLDLGVLYPGDAAGLPPFSIEPGIVADIRFVAAMPGTTVFSTSATNPAISMELVMPDGTSRALSPSEISSGGRISLVLATPGVYHLRMTSAASGPIELGLSAQASRTDSDSLIRSGIGQGPALDLRLINPQAPTFSSPTPSNPTSPSVPLPSTTTETALTPPRLANPAGPDPSSFAATDPGRIGQVSTASTLGESLTATAPSHAIPVVDLGGQLVGRPDSRADHVATVASANTAGSNGLAANQALLPLGLILDPSRIQAAQRAELAGSDDPEGFQNGAIVDRGGLRKSAEPGEKAEVDMAEAAPGTDWVDQALAAIGNLFAPNRAAETPSTVDERLAASIDPFLGDPEETGETKVRHQIGLAEPVGLTLLIAALTQQGRRVLRRRAAEQSGKSSRPSPAPRPHHGRLSAGRASLPSRYS